MRILCIILVDMWYNTDVRSLEWATFWPACQEIGTTRLFPFWREERRLGREGMNASLLHEAEEFEPDIVFVVPWHDNFLEGTMASTGVPTIAWFSDAYREDFVKQEAHHYSHCVVMDEIAKGHVLDVCPDKPVFQSMWACNPKMHKTYDPDRPIDFIWAGLNQKDRHPYIARMVEEFGSWGERAVICSDTKITEPLLHPADYAVKHGSAKISVSLSLNVRGWAQPKTRPFEIAGCGAHLLASKPNTLEGYFDEGTEYTPLSSPDEMVSLVHYYLRHRPQSAAIAAAAQRRAHEEHTYEKRLRNVFQWALGEERFMELTAEEVGTAD